MTKNEFERLQPGQLIQNKKDNKWAFIVHQNFGDRITVVRTMEIRDPENWETTKKSGPNEAALELHELLKDKDWYKTIGVGSDELFVYTSKKKFPKDYTTFREFPVSYRYMGPIKPA